MSINICSVTRRKDLPIWEGALTKAQRQSSHNLCISHTSPRLQPQPGKGLPQSITELLLTSLHLPDQVQTAVLTREQ